MIDFHNIRSTPSGKRDSFEELACLVFREEYASPVGSTFHRLRGDGGDGGVEAYFAAPDGSVHAVQAKYFFKLGPSEFTQIKESLSTAQSNYAQLSHYRVCVPFNLTGKKSKGKTGTSETERFTAWKLDEEAAASARGQHLTIELCGASEFESFLARTDHHGGMRRYWFSETVLTTASFQRALDEAKRFAGPRYTAALDVTTAAHEALDFFGGMKEVRTWVRERANPILVELDSRRTGFRKACDVLPEEDADTAIAAFDALRRELVELCTSTDIAAARNALKATVAALSAHAQDVENLRYAEFCRKHGATSDTPAFRQWHAEYQASFPAEFLDSARETKEVAKRAQLFLDDQVLDAATARSLLLVGPAGVGKTHALVSAAERRFSSGAYSVVLFGDDFNNTEVWTVIRDRLGFSSSVSRDELYSCLDACSQATEHSILVIIDALNEGPMGQRWKRALPRFLEEVRPYSRIKVCVSTRDAYRDVVTDSAFPGHAFTHNGFAGHEAAAMQQFAEAYELAAGVVPTLLEEFANPLFLHLVCSALRGTGDKALDVNLQGFSSLFEQYLRQSNTGIRERLGIRGPRNLCREVMMALALRPESTSGISWEDAVRAASTALNDDAPPSAFLDELRAENLIIISGDDDKGFKVRLAYQRYGDVLRALAALDQAAEGDDPDEGLDKVAALAATADQGLLEALACLLPERTGVELCDARLGLPPEHAVRLVLNALPLRATSSVSTATQDLIAGVLEDPTHQAQALKALLRVSLNPSHPLNAYWLHQQLAMHGMAFTDGMLMPHLTAEFDAGVTRQLIEACLQDTALAWPTASRRLAAMVLGWFGGSTDRRVRDRAGKALTRLFQHNPEFAAETIRCFAVCDDDFIKENLAGAAYAACLLTPRANRACFEPVLSALLAGGFDGLNILIRDHVRLFGATLTECLPNLAADPALNSYPAYVALPSTWPTKEQAQELLRYPGGTGMNFVRMYPYEDFWQYQVRPSVEEFDLSAKGVSLENLAAWLMCHVLELGYPGPGMASDRHDVQLLNLNGGGRSRMNPHAERIGKKYSWIALHRLVGLLSDNVSPVPQKEWETPRSSPASVLWSLRLRKADFTDMRDVAPERTYPDLLIDARHDFRLAESDRDWIAGLNITPHEECLLRTDEYGHDWLPLYLVARDDARAWGDSNSKPCRQIVLRYQCVFLKDTYSWEAKGKRLRRDMHNLSPASYRLYFGEYPKSEAFRRAVDAGELYVRNGAMEYAFWELMRGGEWEYDYSWFPKDAPNLLAPGPSLIKSMCLDWDSRSGWIDSAGELAAMPLKNERMEALFVRRSVLDAFLEAQGMVAYWQRFVNAYVRDSIQAPQLDWSSYCRYSCRGTIEVLPEEERKLFEPDEATGVPTQDGA